MKKYIPKLKKYIMSNRLFLSYVLLSAIGTILVRYYTFGKIFNLFPLITDLGLIILIGSFGYLFKPKKQFNYFFVCLCFYTLAEVVNSIYYVFYINFASFGDIATLSQAETVAGSIWEKLRLFYIFYLMMPFIYCIIHNSLVKTYYFNILDKVEKGKRLFVKTLLVGLCFLIVSFSFAKASDYSRLAKQWNRVYIVERFGIILYQLNDFVQTLSPKIGSMFGYEEAKAQFDEYYSGDEVKKYTGENEYSGILKDMNVVFVHMESMEDFLMDLSFNGGEVTPNLNKLAKEGMFFENFYPEVSTGTSSDTEFTLLTSLMPASSGTVFVSYYDRSYNALPKILTKNGYYTYSMHGNMNTMWNRNKVHPNLGYQDMYFEESFNYTMDDVINLGINDRLFFEEAIPIMENIESTYPNYMGTIITLSNHSPYQFFDKYGKYDMSLNYYVIDPRTGNKVYRTSNYLEGTEVGNFIQSVHYADIALGDFIKYIKESDAFDNTVFVFYGDHDAKLTKQEKNILYNYNIYENRLYNEGEDGYVSYDAFDHTLNKKTPLIIWTKNKELKNVFTGTVDYYMGMIDVQPTILNMLGYKNEYALGKDIFNSKENNIIPFPNGNFITDKMIYNNSTGEYKMLSDNTIINENYIIDRKEYVENLLDVSNSIIVYDLLK